MKRTHFVFHVIITLAAMLLWHQPAFGDYIILKTGEKIEGKIIAEDDQSVTLQYYLTTKIRDTIKYPKSEVAKIVREAPSELEFREKQFPRLLPSRDLLAAADYDNIIEGSLRPFLARFPSTPEAKRVEDMIAIMLEEQARVRAGELKVEGQWLDAASVKRERYEIDAYRDRFGMDQELASNLVPPGFPREIGALRQFEELRTRFPASLHYVKTIPVALAILDAYDQTLAQMAAEYPVLVNERRKTIEELKWTDLMLRTQTAISEEERKFRKSFKEQAAAGMKWREVYRYDLPSITLAQETVAAERQMLEGINLRALQFENENLSGARRCLIDGKPQEADTFLARLRPVKTTLVNRAVFDELEKMLKSKLAR